MDEFEIPREIDEIAPSPESVAEDMRLVRALKWVSNTFGLTLFFPQFIAGILMLMLALVSFLFRAFVLGDRSASFSMDFLGTSDSVGSNLASGLIYFAYMFIPFALQSYFLRENPFHIVPMRAPRNWRGIFPGLAAVLAVAGLASLVTAYMQAFLGFIGLQATSPEGLALPQSGPAAAIYVLQICVLAPVCEEFIFRGMILQNLRRFGNGFAVVTSSLLFAMVHGDLLQMPLAFMMGVVFGVLAVELDSIWVTIGMHAAVNGLSVITDAVSRQTGDGTAQVLYYVVTIVALGICVLLYLSTRQRVDWRGRIDRYWQAALPAPFAIKRFFLTPGTVLFTLLTIVVGTLYMKVA